MSTTPTDPSISTPVPTPPATPPANSEPVQLPDDHPLVKAFNAQKEEIRGLKATGQANADAAAKLAEIEEASKTEAEKAAERLAELEGKVKDYEQREQVAAWKAEISAETGVPANVLAGSTKDEIAAHAESLKPLIGQAQPADPAYRPIPGEGQPSPLALNSDGIESALKSALGIQ